MVAQYPHPRPCGSNLLIGCSKPLELAQGFGLVTPDPFLCELGGIWA